MTDVPLAASVSVVIITHDRYPYVVEAIACAASQTYPPGEIIVVDDGSREAVEPRYLKEQGSPVSVPVRFTRIDDLGPSAARNAGAALASGDMLALLDDDDLWETTYLGACMERMQDGRTDCILTCMTNFDGTRRWPGKCLPESLDNLDLYERNHGVVGSNIVIRRDVYRSIDGFDEELLGSEDKDFLIRLINVGARISVQREPLVLYRVHPNDKASGVGTFHRFQVSGKARFLEKYGEDMPSRTRRWLRGQAGYFRFMGGNSLSMRVGGLFMVLFNQPLLLAGAVRLVFRHRRPW